MNKFNGIKKKRGKFTEEEENLITVKPNGSIEGLVYGGYNNKTNKQNIRTNRYFCVCF